MACTSGNKNIETVLVVYTGVQAIDGRMANSDVYPAQAGITLLVFRPVVSF